MLSGVTLPGPSGVGVADETTARDEAGENEAGEDETGEVETTGELNETVDRITTVKKDEFGDAFGVGVATGVEEEETAALHNPKAG